MNLMTLDSKTEALDDDACIEAELEMAAYLRETLAPDRRPWLLEHLMQCDMCLQALLECEAGPREECDRAPLGPVRLPPRLPDPAPPAGLDPETSRWPRTSPATSTH